MGCTSSVEDGSSRKSNTVQKQTNHTGQSIIPIINNNSQTIDHQHDLYSNSRHPQLQSQPQEFIAPHQSNIEQRPTITPPLFRNSSSSNQQRISFAECNLGIITKSFNPPRPESFIAVEKCKTAGITFVVASGDSPLTTTSIARTLGILGPDDGDDRVMTGPVIDAMTDEQLDELPNLPLVIGRCSPESKVKMVEAFRRRGKVISMSGDGVTMLRRFPVRTLGFVWVSLEQKLQNKHLMLLF